MSYPNSDFFKHRQGQKRATRINEWYEDKKGNAEARNFFSASKDGVPNNPTNYQSFTPIGSSFTPDGEPHGDLVFRRNPYGDGEQIVQSEGPSFKRPTQWGRYNEGSGMTKDAGRQKFIETRGPGSEMSEPRGMNTGMGGFGQGPRRDEGRPQRKGKGHHQK